MTYKNVALVAGTHGNEPSGVFLLKHWEAEPASVARSTFKPTFLLANPRAVKAGKRYVGTDLNRAFHVDALEAASSMLVEDVQARRINEQLGPKLNQPKCDYIIDLHTSTANMGITLIIYNLPESLRMAAYVKTVLPEVRIYMTDKKYEDTIGLFSVAPNGVLVEVGPIAQNLLRQDILEQNQQAVSAVLDYLEKSNLGQLPELPETVEVYQRGEAVDFPRGADGEIAGVVHKDLQGRDFEPLRKGAPLFHVPGGKDILYEGDEEIWPVFINEAAYYEKGMAFRVTRKVFV